LTFNWGVTPDWNGFVPSLIPNLFNGNDIFIMSSEDDEVYAGHGNDKIYGFAGNDFLKPGSGKNYVDGGDGDDHILSYGNDTLVGGNGSDLFDVYQEKGVTTINDFTIGTDKIMFGHLLHNDITLEGYFKKVKKFSGIAGEFIEKTTKSGTTILFDPDGDKKFNIVFKLKGSKSVTPDDFMQSIPDDYGYTPVAKQAQSPESISFLGLKSAGSTGPSVPLPSGQSSSSQILGALTGTKQGQVLPS